MTIDWSGGSFKKLFVISIGQMDRMFRCSIPGRVITKTQKMVLDTSLFNTQYHKVRIKSKVYQSKERSCVLPSTSM